MLASLKQPFTMTSAPPHLHPSPLSWAGGHVRGTVSPVKAPGWRIVDPDCSSAWRGSFAQWIPDQTSGSWKTCQASLVGDFPLFSGRWPRSGILHGGRCSELTIHWSGLHTGANGGSVSRGKLARPDHWPTLDAQACNYNERPSTWDARAERLKLKGYNGNGAGKRLCVEVKRWPTPIYQDTEEPNNSLSRLVKTGRKHAPTHKRAPDAHKPDPVSGRLNPDWVDALMGLPIGWSDVGRLDLDVDSMTGNQVEPMHGNQATSSV